MSWIKSDKLVLGTYEFDKQFSTLDEYKKEVNPDWLDTAITYNNDYLLKNWDGKIISKISPWMYKDYEFWASNHLNCLGRNQIDVMLVHNTRHPDWISLYYKLLCDPRYFHVGISNASIEDIEEIKWRFDIYPEYLELEINPRYLDLNLITYCREKGIKIISYCILGGKYLAQSMIKDYTLPYLIRFALNFSNLAILRWDSMSQCLDISNALNCDFEFDFSMYENEMSARLNKVIVPELYNLPKMVILDKSGFPYYGNDLSEMDIRDTRINSIDFSMFSMDYDNVELEFITEYQAMLRYAGKSDRIAILNEDGIPTKSRDLNIK